MTALLLVLALAAGPAEAPPPALESPAAPLPAAPAYSPFAAAAWCIVTSEETAADEGAGDDEATDAPGCDIGMGVAMATKGRLAWVAVIGTQTIGSGLAWRVSGQGPQVVAVALGAVVRYDEHGIHGEQVYLAAGATLSFARGQ